MHHHPHEHPHEHSHGHSHGGTHHHPHVGAGDQRSILIAIGTTASIFVVQVIGSIMSHSLALLSDSAHMFIDITSLFIAYLGLHIAQRNDKRHIFTFGWRRVEIIAALFNGILLFVMCGHILWEAAERFAAAEHVHASQMLVVACFGFVANAVALYFLHGSEHLTTRSAYLHVLTDLLSSAGVIIGAVLMHYTGWDIVDPIISVFITLFVLRGAYVLIRRAVVILMESAPSHINIADVHAHIAAQPSVVGVHDVHVWQLGSDSHAVSAHVVIDNTADNDTVLRDVRETLRSAFGLHHATVQVETRAFSDEENCKGCAPGANGDTEEQTPAHN